MQNDPHKIKQFWSYDFRYKFQSSHSRDGKLIILILC